MSKIYLADHKIIEVFPNDEAIAATKETNYYMQQSHINLLWADGLTGAGIKVGVVDTGVQVDHPMFAGKIVAGKNFLGGDTQDPDDLSSTHYHGTMVTSLIAGNYMNHNLYGVAPDVEIVYAKSMANVGIGTPTWIANGINYCVEQGCDIINCSIGGADEPIKKEAFDNAIAQGIIVVCASGNSATDDEEPNKPKYPAAYDDAVSVGAIDINYSMADFSTYNNFVDIVAPGYSVYGAYPGNAYVSASGTSFSTPLISGTLALLKQKFIRDFGRKPNEAELFAMLIKQTRALPDIDRQHQGHGYFDASINKTRRI